MEASEGGNVQSIVHGQTVIWVLEAAPETDGEVWVTVKVTKALKGQAFANSAMLEVKDPPALTVLRMPDMYCTESW